MPEPSAIWSSFAILKDNPSPGRSWLLSVRKMIGRVGPYRPGGAELRGGSGEPGAAGQQADRSVRRQLCRWGGQPQCGCRAVFLTDIWPKILTAVPEAEFHLVGTASELVRQLAASVPRVRLRGFVDDLAEVYAESAVSVAPIRFGTGTRRQNSRSVCPRVSGDFHAARSGGHCRSARAGYRTGGGRGGFCGTYPGTSCMMAHMPSGLAEAVTPWRWLTMMWRRSNNCWWRG